MKISAISTNTLRNRAAPRMFDSMARHSLFRLLRNIEGGTITLTEGGQTHRFGRTEDDLTYRDPIHVHINVSDPAFYRMILLRGSIGAGEAFMLDFWQVSDLTGAIRLICRNMRHLERMDGGITKLGLGLQRLKHWLSPNTLRGSKRNIHAHYDLSNDLFEYFLDSRMMYSAAMYPDTKCDLETAAAYKLQQVGEKLALTPDDHVIEIGTGWGGLAIYLAEEFGCRVTTTTISHEQHEYAKARIFEKGLQDRITLLEKDYRLLDGQYDKLVSIEMIEAVGHRFLPAYFDKCNALLKPGGRMLIQAITIPEQRYEYAKRNIDFIQRYIFPGGSLPSIEVILNNTGKHSDLQIEHLDDIGLDYALTLKHWRQRFMRDPEDIIRMGFDDYFIRLWNFYLSYCEGGFMERAISTHQVVFRKV
ncbi:MAG: cyclopropane-fatty-acyl-phospholipid synthase [Gammaproteobacteria bacterium]|jgi:cyclopropane-fatty-acyl-phospholipid synthase